MKKFLLFSYPLNERGFSSALLIIRISFALLIMTHGLAKIQNFEVYSKGFPDLIGLGSQLSLILAIGAEFVAGIFVIFGFLTRLSLIPMVFTMGVAVFVAHAADPFQAKELALVYLIAFIALFILGPGEYSLDRLLFSRERNSK